MFFDFRLLLLLSPAKEKLLMNFFRCKLLPRDSWQNFHLEKQRSNIGALGVLTKELMFVEHAKLNSTGSFQWLIQSNIVPRYLQHR